MNSKASYSTRFPRGNRSLQELFHTPRPQIISAGPCLYNLQIGKWRLRASLPLKDIQCLYSRLASHDWRLVDGAPADSAKILAAANRFSSGGAK